MRTGGLILMLMCGALAAAAAPPEAPPAGLAAVPAEASPSGAPAARPGAADPRAHLEQILQRPLYQRWKLRQARAAPARSESSWSRAVGDYLKRVYDWLGDWLGSWWRGRGPAGSGSAGGGSGGGLGGLFRAMVWVVLTAVVGILAWVIYLALRDRTGAGEAACVLSRAQVRQALEEGRALALDAPGWLTEADQLAAAQDNRAVYRALYLALLSGLHAAGTIDFRKNRTNWVYVGGFRGAAPQRDIFARLTGAFDEAWYGLRGAEAARVGELRAAVAALVAGGPGHG